MDGFFLAVWLVLIACLVAGVWENLTRPNLQCRWLGHSILMRDGWAYCTRCGWREPLAAVDD